MSDTLPAEPVSEVGRYDLHELFEQLGGMQTFAGDDGGMAAERPNVAAEVDIVESEPAPVDAEPADVACFVDGIQASRKIRYRDHRPIRLDYLAAGALSPSGARLDEEERLELVCSHLDVEWLRPRSAGLPIAQLVEELPPEVESAQTYRLGVVRENLERELTRRLLDQVGDEQLVVVDGALSRNRPDRRLTGVVKTLRTKYLPDEQVLWQLRAGWRSPVFRIAAQSADAQDVFSCYLRLSDPSGQRWGFALVRLEAYDRALLEPLASRCLTLQQFDGRRDARFDRHLAPVRAVEDYLRARRPPIF